MYRSAQEYATYHSVTTSFEYVFVGTDFALARPVKRRMLVIKWSHSQTLYSTSVQVETIPLVGRRRVEESKEEE